jgi:hypothetical protein
MHCVDQSGEKHSQIVLLKKLYKIYFSLIVTFTFFIFLSAFHSYDANKLVTKALTDTLAEPVTSKEVSLST